MDKISPSSNYNRKIQRMYSSEEKRDIIINTLLYILQQLGGAGDFHRVFKILYFADVKHLAKYGSTITPDRYIAMDYGPVPSLAYDIFKALRNHGPLAKDREEFMPYFEEIRKNNFRAKQTPDLDYLSESEIECINEAIKANGHLTFDDRTDKSHDAAWTNTLRNKEISVLKIAAVGGAEEGMLAYIKECIENVRVFSE